MATFDYSLKISDGTTTVTLTSTPFDIREYQPRVGTEEERTVSETCEVRVTDGTVANNLDEIRAVNKLLNQAKRAQKNRALAKVYLLWKSASAATEYRSEIKDGRAEWDAAALTLPYWRGDTQFVLIHWERVNYWEGPEAQLALTNPNGTGNTDGLTVYNCNDQDGASPNVRANYVDITGTAVLGDLPGVTRLELTNTYNSEAELYWVWIGQNVFTPSTFNHIIEGETASYGGDVINHASYSDGSAISRTFPGYVEQPLLKWDLTSALAEAALGRLHRITFRSTTMASWNVARYRLKVTYNAAVVWETALVQPDNTYAFQIRNLFTIKLPPWLTGLTDLDGLTLELHGMKTIESPGDLIVDFIQLTPTDGYRELGVATYNVVYTERIVDDGINDRLYKDDGAGDEKAGIVIDYGAPIHVWPGRNQRLYFLMHGQNTAEIDRTLSVKLFYRPRRRSL
jgi:hypothetical protein